MLYDAEAVDFKRYNLRNVFLNHFNSNYTFRFSMPCAIYLNNEALRFNVSQGIQKSLFIIETQS